MSSARLGSLELRDISVIYSVLFRTQNLEIQRCVEEKKEEKTENAMHGRLINRGNSVKRGSMCSTVYKRFLKGLFCLPGEKELVPFIADKVDWIV